MTGAADFWSRRKAQVAAEDAAEARAAEAQAEAQAEAAQEAALAGKSDAEICEELDLPDPDTLEAGDDFRAFMDRAVPERLRRRALRRLWTSSPVLANLDGMIDYGEDFTDSTCVIEGMQTTYQVGKGMLAHVQEMARQAEAEAAAEAATEAGDDAPGQMALAETETEADPEPEMEAAPEAAPEAGHTEAAGTEDETTHDAVPPRRRMRFAFADTAGEQA